MKRLYVDITELVTWQGKLTGVPRVMSELSKRLAREKNSIFVKWISGSYEEVINPIYQEETLNNNGTISDNIPAKSLIKKMVSRIPVANKVAGSIKKQKALNSKSIIINPEDTLLVLADWHGSDTAFVEYLTEAVSRGVRLVQVVYDMLPLVTPQYSGHSTGMLENYSKKIYPLCQEILAISENTKNDISGWLRSNNLKTPSISVFRLGDDFTATNPKKVDAAREKDFILCVGTIEARKNHALLYYTYKLAKGRGRELPQIVVVGRVGWLANDIYQIIKSDPDVRDKFIFLHSVDDDELAWLYKNCLFSIYPSFYEGWGLPVAESLARGVPCIASNTSSIPEIAGKLINYFSPASSEECLSEIERMLDKKEYLKALSNTKKYKAASWDDSYKMVRKVLRI